MDNNINGDGSGDGVGGDGTDGGGGDSGGGDASDAGRGRTKKTVVMLSSSDKQGSAIDLDIGPPLDEAQTLNYKTIQKILIRMNRLCVQSGFGSNTNNTNIGNQF